MVYNAMKLFMEVNPQLFDDCSHDYAEQQNHAQEKQQNRQARWEKLAEIAKMKQNGRVQPPLATTTGQGAKITTPMKPDDADPLSQERRNLEGLRLQDDGVAKEKRQKEASSNSVS
jgi:serine/threonine-protein phosphatase 2A regulatory subunit B'